LGVNLFFDAANYTVWSIIQACCNHTCCKHCWLIGGARKNDFSIILLTVKKNLKKPVCCYFSPKAIFSIAAFPGAGLVILGK